MQVSLLSTDQSAVRDALRAHAWQVEMARETAAGMSPAAFHVSGIASDVIEALLPVASKLGIQMISGPDWLILVGPRSRIGAFARPWLQPEALRELATAIGVAMPAEAATVWQHARGVLSLEAPVIMGILNVTPDSFSDGGKLPSVDAVIHRAEELINGGAGILDVGGASTRPGAVEVSFDDEFERVIPAVKALHKHFPDIPVSIDTTRSEMVAPSLDAGAAIINDVTAGRHDSKMIPAAAKAKTGIVLSHSVGALGSIADLPSGDEFVDITTGVASDLSGSWQLATAAGMSDEQIVLDPGFGFGKRVDENVRLLQQLDALVALGRPVMVGVSRKRFLGALTGRELSDRDRATAAACTLAASKGARLFRVHEPEAIRDAIRVGFHG